MMLMAPAPVGHAPFRVTVVAPKRRIDVALPDSALVGELLPHLLQHAGEDLPSAEDEQADWTLRRTTGAELEVTRNLAAQGVRDGELLQLVPRQMDWPELAYDDVARAMIAQPEFVQAHSERSAASMLAYGRIRALRAPVARVSLRRYRPRR